MECEGTTDPEGPPAFQGRPTGSPVTGKWLDRVTGRPAARLYAGKIGWRKSASEMLGRAFWPPGRKKAAQRKVEAFSAHVGASGVATRKLGNLSRQREGNTPSGLRVRGFDLRGVGPGVSSFVEKPGTQRTVIHSDRHGRVGGSGVESTGHRRWRIGICGVPRILNLGIIRGEGPVPSNRRRRRGSMVTGLGPGTRRSAAEPHGELT